MSELTLAEAAAVVAMYADHDYSPGLALLDGSAARVLQKESHRSRKVSAWHSLCFVFQSDWKLCSVCLPAVYQPCHLPYRSQLSARPCPGKHRGPWVLASLSAQMYHTAQLYAIDMSRDCCLLHGDTHCIPAASGRQN